MPAKNNFNFFEHFRGNEEFVKRVYDRKDYMERTYRIIYTPFLTPFEQSISRQLLGDDSIYVMDGGYDQAEHKCMALCPDASFLMEVKMPIVCLRAKFSKQFKNLTHRDVLGSFMNLGIKREQFGDILIQDDQIYAFVNRENKEYIMSNCTKIAQLSILFEEYEGSVKHHEELDYTEIMVSSLRLDVVVSGITKLSRARAQEMICTKLIKVDHHVLEDCSILCNNNCILSIRGYGRFSVVLRNRITKKGRIVVTIGHYV